jgi:hypothetical protein
VACSSDLPGARKLTAFKQSLTGRCLKHTASIHRVKELFTCEDVNISQSAREYFM